MRRFVIVFVLAMTLALPFPAAFAQTRSSAAATATASSNSQRGVDLITAAQMKDYLYFIASDEMEGRDTPSRGLDTTAKFIAMNLSRWGLKPMGDDGSFFQRIALRREKVDVAGTRAEINGTTYTPGADFIAFSNAGSASNAPLVYVGNGWLIKSKNIDAYQGIEVKDKIVVLNGSEGLPKGVSFADFRRGKRGVDWADPLSYAQMRGAKGVIAIAAPEIIANWDSVRTRQQERSPVSVEKFKKEDGASSAPMPRIIISQKMAAALLDGEKQNLDALNKGIAANEPIAPFDFSPTKKVSFNVATTVMMEKTQNVVAVWEGSDPVLKNEYVAVGAHYDHIGIGNPVDGDAINNGADDDGSGTTGILAMAEALSHATARPKRSTLFVWHCGEEKGLWGSQYFTTYPTVPLDHVVTQLNIDMIGRSKPAGDTNERDKELTGPNEIYVIGSRMMSTELGALTESVNKSYLNLTFDYRYDDPNDPNRFFFRSDHFNYASKGIPIVFFFDGEHQDYHRPGDSPDKIDYQKMEKVTRTVYMMLWELSNRAARVVVDKKLPGQLTMQ
jgi:hypothetical protein